MRLLKSIVFGIVATVVLTIAAFGIATSINYFERLGNHYTLVPVLLLVCVVCSVAYYFGNE